MDNNRLLSPISLPDAEQLIDELIEVTYAIILFSVYSLDCR